MADITLRALDVLKSADLVLAEDTRNTGILFKHYDISTRLKSFHIFNEHKSLEGILNELKTGKVYAMVSDAGTPAISDPGFLLVRACIKEKLKVECLPGATALIPALVGSGFPTERFVFEGFLPVKKGRQSRIDELVDELRTMVFYESPHRLLKTLDQLGAKFGMDREVSVSRELTKIHEETFVGNFEEVKNYFSEKSIKGEIVIVVAGKGKK